MKCIWKYPLSISTNKQVIEMPENAKCLCVNQQNEVPTIWALVDDGAKKQEITIWVLGTGRLVPNVRLQYLGSCPSGRFMCHVFMERTKNDYAPI